MDGVGVRLCFGIYGVGLGFRVWIFQFRKTFHSINDWICMRRLKFKVCYDDDAAAPCPQNGRPQPSMVASSVSACKVFNLRKVLTTLLRWSAMPPGGERRSLERFTLRIVFELFLTYLLTCIGYVVGHCGRIASTDGTYLPFGFSERLYAVLVSILQTATFCDILV